MILYHYDKSTKKHTKQSEARKDPLDTGNYLVPANATAEKPPVVSGNESSLFVDGKWTVVVDRIGQHFYQPDGTKIIISEFGHDIPDGSITDDPLTKYQDSHNGLGWIENIALKEQDALLDEIRTLKSDMVEFMAYHFAMTQALFETLIAKGVFTPGEIDDDVLKAKYAEWKPKVNRYRELND